MVYTCDRFEVDKLSGSGEEVCKAFSTKFNMAAKIWILEKNGGTHISLFLSFLFNNLSLNALVIIYVVP